MRLAMPIVHEADIRGVVRRMEECRVLDEREEALRFLRVLQAATSLHVALPTGDVRPDQCELRRPCGEVYAGEVRGLFKGGPEPVLVVAVPRLAVPGISHKVKAIPARTALVPIEHALIGVDEESAVATDAV